MKFRKENLLGIVFLFGILLMLSFISAPDPYTRSYVQYSSPGTISGINQNMYFDQAMCEKIGQDFLVQVAPLGCSPAVVRSDLLEEQDVPVLCPLSATKLNPLIDVEAIDNIVIGVSGKYPEEISGFGFHSARDALRSPRIGLDSSTLNNIGYALIILRRQPNESAMPEFVTGNLTATIRYDIKNAFGVGDASFYIPELSDVEWNRKYSQYGFWQSRGYLRAESIEEDVATISLYSDVSGYGAPKNKITSVRLEEGETSQKIYLPGMGMCLANLELKLESLEAADIRARIKVNSDVLELAENEWFLDNKCQLTNLVKQGLVQEVDITCKNDQGKRDSFELKISPQVNLKIDGGEMKNYSLGDVLYEMDLERKVFLGYIGKEEKDGTIFIVPVLSPHKNSEQFLNSLDLEALQAYTGYVETDISTGIGFVDFITKIFQISSAGAVKIVNTFARGVDYGNWVKLGEEKEISFISETIRTEGLANIVGFTKYVFGADTRPETYVQKKIEFVSLAEPQNRWDMKALENIGKYEKSFKTNYTKAFEDYQKIIESYSSEEYIDVAEKITLGEQASFEQIELAFNVGQFGTVKDLCKRFIEAYPKSKKKIDDEYCKENKLANSEISVQEVIINGQVKKISFEDIYEPTFEEYGVEIYVSGAEGGYNGKKELRKNQRIFVSEKESIVLKELEANSAIFDVRDVEETTTQQLTYTPQNLLVKLGDYEIIGAKKYTIRVEKINLKKSAKVSVISGIKNAGTEADFSFNIGIEKRAQILTPEQIENRIEDLDKNIEKWQNISENWLAPTIKLGKTACLATGAWLTVSNFLDNAQGKGISRQTVMRSAGGWYELCADYTENKTFKSEEACLIEFSPEIEKDVENLDEIRQEQNDNIKEIESWNLIKEGQGLFKETVVNTDEFMKDYTENVKDILERLLIIEPKLINPNDDQKVILVSEMIPFLSYERWGKATFSISQLREIELHARILLSNSNDRMKKMSRETLYKLFEDVKLNSEEHNAKETFAQRRGVKEATISSSTELKEIVLTETDTFGEVWLNYPIIVGSNPSQSLFDPSIDDIKPEEIIHAYIDNADGKEYLLVLNSDYVVSKTYLIGASMKRIGGANPNPLGLSFKMYNAASYENKFKDAQVRYYEIGDYSGLPGIVPFDLENGWYAATKSNLPVGTSLRSYDSSGRVNSFYLCNVGGNSREEFNSGIGDDDCAMINLGTGHPYDQFPGLEPSKASKLVNDAVKAIQEASDQKQRNPKINCVDISGVSGCIPVGDPALDIPDIKCEDFMSPKDCNLIFNFCDPVICPSSRCDFGGTYHVKDVIQSGIVGSSLLCLPNWNEGIKVPVCLTGIKAGIDGLLSVEKSYKQCLGDTLEKGETAGICDEVHSMYMCDFFWRQGIPLAKIALPNIAGSVLQQNVRGGGEYFGVKDAWAQAQASTNLFTQYYAENSFSAFKVGSTAEIGSAVCKNFISAKFPSGGDLIDSITNPDSPAQFHGRFDEIPFTSVTNPPISHYKVFYHIYAGAEKGAYYQVYLTSGQEGTFYEDATGIRMVNSSYIPAGGYASVTSDFTAPTGFKKLCINVNGQEECGFKEVSTSFAVDYITESYLADQAGQKDIQTTAECISGTASSFSLLNPNTQAGVEEYIDPAIYNKGIIRFCATDNPGKATNALKWVEVGYCDNQKMKCWLDTESVKDVIKVPNLITGQNLGEQAVEEVTQSYIDLLINRDGYLSEEEVKNAINQIKKEENPLQKITSINDVLEKIFLNKEKGQMHLLRGNAYREIAFGIYRLLTSKTEGVYIVESIGYVEGSPAYEPNTEEYKKSATTIISVLDLNDNKLEFALGGYDSLLIDFISFEFGRIVDYTRPLGPQVNFAELKLSEVQKGDIITMSKEDRAETESGIVVREDTFISPIFEFQDGTGTDNLYYQYSKGVWNVSFDKEVWFSSSYPIDIETGGLFGFNPSTGLSNIRIKEPNDKSKKFIKDLEGKNYLEGLKLLIKRTKEDSKEGQGFWGVVTDWVGGKPVLSIENDVEMDSKALFTIQRDKSLVSKTRDSEDQEVSYKTPVDLYIKFLEEGWRWSFDQKNWMKPTEEDVKGGEYDKESPSLPNILLLRELSRVEKGFYDGAVIIFSGEIPEGPVAEKEFEEIVDFSSLKLSSIVVGDIITTSKGIYAVSRFYSPTDDEGVLVIKVLNSDGEEIELTRNAKDALLINSISSDFGEITKYEKNIEKKTLTIDFVGLPEPKQMNRLDDYVLLGKLSIQDIIVANAESKYGISKPLIQAIIIQESYADASEGVTDKKGSFGLMQVSEIAARDVKDSVPTSENENLYQMFTVSEKGKYDPETNIFLGTAYYSLLRKRLKDFNSEEDVDKITLMAYNWGIGKISANCENKNFKNCNDKIPPEVLQYASNILAYASKLEEKRGIRQVIYFTAKESHLYTLDEAIFIWDDDIGYWQITFPGKKTGPKTYNLGDVEKLVVGFIVNKEIWNEINKLLDQQKPVQEREKGILKIIEPETQAPIISQPVIFKSKPVKVDTSILDPDTGFVETEIFWEPDSIELGYSNPQYIYDAKLDTIHTWGIFPEDSLYEIFGKMSNEEIVNFLDADNSAVTINTEEEMKGTFNYDKTNKIFTYKEPVYTKFWDTGELILTQCPPKTIEKDTVVTGQTCEILQKEERKNIWEYFSPGMPGFGFDPFVMPVFITFNPKQEVFQSDSLNTNEVYIQLVAETKTNEKGEIILENTPTKILFTDSNGVALDNFEFSVVDETSDKIFGTHQTTIVGQALVKDTFESILGKSPREILIPEYEGPETIDVVEVDKRIKDIYNNVIKFQEYCSLNIDFSGENYCAEYVTQVFDYIFGGGRSYLIGVTGNAKSFQTNMLAAGGSTIYNNPTASVKFTNYDSLKKGDVLGLARTNSPSGYTHVALYLGNINGEHYLTHKIGEIIYVQSLEELKRDKVGGYFWEPRVILRPNQENLYFTPVGYKNKYNFVLVKYRIKESQGDILGDTLGSVARRFTSNSQHQGAIMWMIRDFTGRDTVRAGTVVELYVPVDSLAEATTEFDIYRDLREGIDKRLSFRMDKEERDSWEDALEFAFEASDVKKTPENFAIVLAVIEKESSFYENPELDMKGICEEAIKDYETNSEEASWGRWKACTTYWEEAIAIKTEKDYVNSVFQKGNFISNSADFVFGLFGSDKFNPQKLTSAGPMQVNIETAMKLSREDGEIIEETQMYDYLFTKPEGIYYGVKNLKPILETYPPEEDLNNLDFIFADYNAGLYKSRNAAFQNRINVILGVKELQEDGVLGIKTARALNKILGKEIQIASNGRIVGSDIKSFEDSSMYKRIDTEYKKKTGQEPIYAIVPDISTESIKYDKPLTVVNYVKNSIKFFDNYCDYMKNCDLNEFIKQRKNKLEVPSVDLSWEGPLIIIDPGHGGDDPGRVGVGYQESKINLEISKMFKDDLQKKGANVLMTREFDSGANINNKDFNGDGKVNNLDDLRARADFANEKGADYFISVHSNYNEDSSEIKGSEIYIYCYCSEEDLTNGKVDICQDVNQCLNKGQKYSESLDLARKIEQSMKALGFEVRSLAGMDASVLERTNMPALLVEVGYLSNEQDLENILNYPEKYSSALSDSLSSIMV